MSVPETSSGIGEGACGVGSRAKQTVDARLRPVQIQFLPNEANLGWKGAQLTPQAAPQDAPNQWHRHPAEGGITMARGLICRPRSGPAGAIQ